ncbi:hypothetical protein BJ742DRAFT_831814, partial [Cladochytrium replicatum]
MNESGGNSDPEFEFEDDVQEKEDGDDEDYEEEEFEYDDGGLEYEQGLEEEDHVDEPKVDVEEDRYDLESGAPDSSSNRLSVIESSSSGPSYPDPDIYPEGTSYFSESTPALEDGYQADAIYNTDPFEEAVFKLKAEQRKRRWSGALDPLAHTIVPEGEEVRPPWIPAANNGTQSDSPYERLLRRLSYAPGQRKTTGTRGILEPAKAKAIESRPAFSVPTGGKLHKADVVKVAGERALSVAKGVEGRSRAIDVRPPACSSGRKKNRKPRSLPTNSTLSSFDLRKHTSTDWFRSSIPILGQTQAEKNIVARKARMREAIRSRAIKIGWTAASNKNGKPKFKIMSSNYGKPPTSMFGKSNKFRPRPRARGISTVGRKGATFGTAAAAVRIALEAESALKRALTRDELVAEKLKARTKVRFPTQQRSRGGDLHLQTSDYIAHIQDLERRAKIAEDDRDFASEIHLREECIEVLTRLSCGSISTFDHAKSFFQLARCSVRRNRYKDALKYAIKSEHALSLHLHALQSQTVKQLRYRVWPVSEDIHSLFHSDDLHNEATRDIGAEEEDKGALLEGIMSELEQLDQIHRVGHDDVDPVEEFRRRHGQGKELDIIPRDLWKALQLEAILDRSLELIVQRRLEQLRTPIVV